VLVAKVKPFWQIASSRVLLWAVTVLLFAFIPNLIHWGVKAMNQRPSLFDRADMFLYVFVLWATFLTEVVTDTQPGIQPSAFMISWSFVMGIFASLGFAFAQIQTDPSKGSLDWGLGILLSLLIACTIAVCVLYKVPSILGKARAEWKHAKQQPDRAG
jgi:hypothetical protein